MPSLAAPPKLSLDLPTSKSMTQRALILAALADGPSRIRRPLWCDDSRHLSGLLGALGSVIEWQHDGPEPHVTVQPNPLSATDATLFCGNAGTALRFGACLSLLLAGPLTLDGDAHMRKRPIAPLIDSLARLGVHATYGMTPGCPPVRLETQGALKATRIGVDASLSSQFASGLLLVAPCLPEGLTVELLGKRVSRPYITMTLKMMAASGAHFESLSEDCIRVAPGGYRAIDRTIEADWSAAAFLLAAQWITGLEFELPGLVAGAASLQGDAVCIEMLEQIRAPAAATLDLSQAPDLIAPLAAAALFAEQPTQLVGVAHARVKECDRPAVLARELRKLGASLDVGDDSLRIVPLTAAQQGQEQAMSLDPEGDHRMAMTFGLVSLRLAGVRVSQPECVSKSFPDFWVQLEAIRAVGAPRRAPGVQS